MATAASGVRERKTERCLEDDVARTGNAVREKVNGVLVLVLVFFLFFFFWKSKILEMCSRLPPKLGFECSQQRTNIENVIIANRLKPFLR